jgi:hypothetical protein
VRTATQPSAHAQFEAAIAEAQHHTPNGIPLVDFDQLDLKDANAAALINAMADIIVSMCSRTALAMPAAAASTKAA